MPTLSLDKYRIIAELGQGGMAHVYLAVTTQNTMFSKLVVIKQMKEHLVNDAEFMTMFVDEARIAARLNHPNLVQTLEVGESGGQHFLTMEYLDGQPLHRILARAKETFPSRLYLSVLVDVLEGMHYAHELKDFDGAPLDIVHRDVTPQNIFVVYEGQVKIVDFGIAKAAGRASETRHGVIKGKVTYMAPEQALGQMVDRRVDVFAIGVMAFEAAVGRRMWKGVKDEDIIRSLIKGRIPGPKDFDENVDDELDRIVRKALAHNADDRYATAADFQTELAAYLHSKGPRPTARELGGFISELFADKRKLTSKIIEQQLAKLKRASILSVAQLPQATEPVSGAEPSSSPDVAERPSLPFQTPSMPPARSRPSIPYQPPPPPLAEGDRGETVLRESSDRRKLLLGAVVALLVLVISAMVSVIVLRSTAGSHASKPITVTLRATPLETRFSIDGAAALENPFIGEFPRDRKEHKIRAIAPGFSAKEEVVLFDEDVSMRFTLAGAK
jgi:serine/threonine-protein kinase